MPKKKPIKKSAKVAKKAIKALAKKAVGKKKASYGP